MELLFNTFFLFYSSTILILILSSFWQLSIKSLLFFLFLSRCVLILRSIVSLSTKSLILHADHQQHEKMFFKKNQIQKRVLNMTFKMEMTMLNVNDRHSVWAPDKRLKIEWVRWRETGNWTLFLSGCLHDTISPRLLVHYISKKYQQLQNNQHSMSALYLMIKTSHCTIDFSSIAILSYIFIFIIIFVLEICQYFFINWHLGFSSRRVTPHPLAFKVKPYAGLLLEFWIFILFHKVMTYVKYFL